MAVYAAVRPAAPKPSTGDERKACAELGWAVGRDADVCVRAMEASGQLWLWHFWGMGYVWARTSEVAFVLSHAVRVLQILL